MTHRELFKVEYGVWRGMWRRCTDSSRSDYRWYGARGVTVDDAWRSFRQFLADMGSRPSPKHSIDRRDNTKPYGPGNCRWATMKQQERNRQNNRWLEYRGERRVVSEWAEMFHIRAGVVYVRLNNGWDPHRALTAPVRAKAKNGCGLRRKDL